MKKHHIKPAKSETIHLNIQGMRCSGCISSIERALSGVDGVINAEVNFADHSAIVSGYAEPRQLIDAVQVAGYHAEIISHDEDEKQNQEHLHYIQLLKQAGLAALLGIPLIILAQLKLLPGLSTLTEQFIWLVIGIITLAIMIYSGGHFYRGAWNSFRNHQATMDTLIGLGTGAAWLFSIIVIIFPDSVPRLAQHAYFEAAVIIIALVNFGSALEMRARGKTRDAIQSLMKLQPKTATLLKDGQEEIIAISDIQTGDLLRVKPGEQVPVDGEITEGYSSIDESMLTGEAIPIEKNPKDKVIGGTLNKTGSFIFKATHVGKNTALANIIKLVKQAQHAKPAIARLADRISAYFVPSVMIASVITVLIWFNVGPAPQSAYMLVCGMTVLIIACPCALGLAAPISVMIATGKAAEAGILIRNGDALQLACKLDTIVLDKTGTITEGRPLVKTIHPANSWKADDLLIWAASIEVGSEHALADAISKEVKEKSLNLLPRKEFEAITGQGVKAIIKEKQVLFGNAKLMLSHHISLGDSKKKAEELASKAETPMYLAVDKQICGIISVADPIKTDSMLAIKQLQDMGLEVVMITGDHQKTAQAIAHKIGIKQYYANVMPGEKADKVADLQKSGHIVAMVGDGVNDAPALSQANLGFAIGSGTDVAIESADITLMRDSLLGVVDTITVSRKTLRNIKQNFFGAFMYNALGIPVAAGILYPFSGILLNPMFAGAAMAMSSLTVVTNANRLRKLNLRK